MSTNSTWRLPHVGSGTVIVLGTLLTFTVLLSLGQFVGWDATWRSLDVTPLQPHFFDMHVVADYATCASKGVDPWIPHSCNPANLNIPPIWLWLGLWIAGPQLFWVSVAITAAALAVIAAIFSGRSVIDGAIALAAILSPPIMMGVERSNPDLFLLILVGAAALIYQEQRLGRLFCAIALIGFGIVLKLFPMFCITVSARFNRRTVLFSGIIIVFSLAYLAAIFDFIPLIRRNVPTTFILSYGYKTLFLGLDHLRIEAGLPTFSLADTWLPIVAVTLTLLCAAAAVLICFYYEQSFCTVANSTAGIAFLFGSGIYCGTFLLGTNFIYRLMFLLLCLPQLQDWQRQRSDDNERKIELGLFATVLSVLWLNGNSNGHSTFLLVPQLLNWLLFFSLATVLMSNFLKSVLPRPSPRFAASQLGVLRAMGDE